MLLESGRVVAVEADAVWVETIRKTTCGACAVSKGCGHGLLNRLSPARRPLVRALPGRIGPADCRVDDEVQISIPEGVIVRGSMVVYLLPLVCMLGGGAIGAAFLPRSPDIGGALGVVAGFLAGFALVRLYSRRHRDDVRLQPTLESVQGRVVETLEVS